MKKLITYVFISFWAVFFSCSNKNSSTESKKEAQTVVTLTEEDLPEIEYLRLEKVEMPSELPYSYMIYKDTLVITNTEYPSPYFMSVFGLNSKQLLGQCYMKGVGPGEMSYCRFMIKSGKVFAHDVSMDMFSEMEVDKLISLGSDYVPTLVHTTSSLKMSFDVFDDNTLIGSNEDYLDGYERSKGVPELLKIDIQTGRVIADTDLPDIDYFAGNVTGGIVVNFKESKQIMLAMYKRPCIMFFDRELNLVKRVVGPENNDIEFEELEGGYNYEEYNDARSLFYVESYIDGNEVFVLNNRVYKYEIEKYINKHEVAKSQEVWVFDMKGDIKRRYKIENPESVIYSISYSAATQTLYANSYDEDGETIFCRCVPVE